MKPRSLLLLLAILISNAPAAFSEENGDPAKTAPNLAESAREENSPVEDEAADLDYIRAKNSIFEQKYSEAVKYLEKALKKDPKSPHLNNEISKVYSLVGEFDKAVAAAKISVEADPKKVEYRFNLAEALTSAKSYAEARKEYSKVLELEPTNQRAGLLVAIIDSEMGDDAKAIESLSKLIRENSDNPIPLFYRARIYLEKNQIEEAKVDLEKCLQQRPSFVEAGTALGLIFEKNNEIDEAIRVYSKIQGQGQFKKRLAFLYIQKNQLAEALEALTEYEQVQPDDYTARVRLGLIHLELKNYDKAKEKFVKTLKEQPDSERINFYLGWVYEAQKQWPMALEQFKKVTKDSAVFAEAMSHVAFIFKETQRSKDGIEFFKQQIRKHKEVAELYDIQASLFEGEKKYNEALKVIEEGLKLTKNDEKLLYFRGALLDKVGKSKEALSIMKNIVETNAEHALALNFIAYYYAERGENLVEAEEKATKALSLRPNDGYITDTLAWIKFKKGEHNAALEKLMKASELVPEEAIIFEHLGDVYSAQQEKEKAVSAYKKAASLAKGKDKDMVKKVESKVASLENNSGNKKQKEERIPSAESGNPKK
ncbi:MAG: tetratricopeptide repeat protein [Deltaproteobacteria bacterium]